MFALSRQALQSRRDHLFPVQTGSVRFQKHRSCSGCWPVPPGKGESEPSLRLWVEFCVSSSVSELEKLCWEMKQLPTRACLAPSVMQKLYLDGQYPTITTSYKPRASFFLNADPLADLLASLLPSLQLLVTPQTGEAISFTSSETEALWGGGNS